MADQQVEKTLSEAMEQAAAEVDSPKGATEAADRSAATDPNAAPAEAPKPWEGPGWSKMWKEGGRKVLEKLATDPNFAEDYKHLLPEIDQVYNFAGRQGFEYGQLKKRFEPVADILAQAEQNYALRGMSLPQALNQLFTVQQQLEQNPDQMLPYLGAQFKPRNAAETIQALSQAWGVDLGQVAQSAPYIDPTVRDMVMPLFNRVQQMEQSAWSREQDERRRQYQAVENEISAFEFAKDESGNPKHPYFRDVYQDMVVLVQMGRANNLNEAYEMATRYHPAAQEARAKEAEAKALREAARTTSEAKQATQAARNINGSAKGNSQGGNLTMREAMELADKQLGAR